MNLRPLILLCVLPLAAASGQPGPSRETNWPSFRGVRASGIADGYAAPTRWNVEANQNLRWKTPLPGLGHSSPVIWGDRIYVTSAVSGKPKAELRVGLYGDIAPVTDDTSHRFQVLCLDKRTGKILWERTAHEGVPKVKRHTKSTHANPTIATDGKNVVAFFGSEGLYCYDPDGNLRWKKEFGVLDSGYYEVPDAQWGFASSPVLHEGKVLLQCDVQKGSFVAALEARDGRELWKTERSDVPTWSTPTVVTEGGRAQVVVNGWEHIGGYDLETGRELWKMAGGGDIPVPTPVAGKGLIFVTNAHGRMAPIFAIRPTAAGDITLKGSEMRSAHVAWCTLREGAYMQTPLVYGDYLYVCRDNGVLSCYEASTGIRRYQERLGTGRTGFTASGIAADGKLYYASEEGEVFVVQAGPEFKLLAANPVGEVCMATPALSEGILYVRTQGHLVAIGPARR